MYTIVISLCWSSTCCCNSFNCMKYGCTSPSSNSLTVGNTHLVAHLKLLWRDIQSWASVTVVFGSGLKETRSVFRFITMRCYLNLRHTPWQGSEQIRPSISINFNLPSLFSILWACMFNTCRVYHDHTTRFGVWSWSRKWRRTKLWRRPCRSWQQSTTTCSSPSVRIGGHQPSVLWLKMISLTLCQVSPPGYLISNSV